jgi:hypothetical protein
MGVLDWLTLVFFCAAIFLWCLVLIIKINGGDDDPR